MTTNLRWILDLATLAIFGAPIAAAGPGDIIGGLYIQTDPIDLVAFPGGTYTNYCSNDWDDIWINPVGVDTNGDGRNGYAVCYGDVSVIVNPTFPPGGIGVVVYVSACVKTTCTTVP